MLLRSLLTLSLGIALWTRSRGADARLRLNTIRSVVLAERHELNGSAWERGVDLQLYQCMSDLECSGRSFCQLRTTGPAHSRCRTCRRKWRRCHRDGMCCPGNRCQKGVCVPDGDVFASQMGDTAVPPEDKQRRKKKDGSASRGVAEERCWRRSDCAPGLCCVRHLWTHVCRPLLQEGQACTRRRRRPPGGAHELFQRCSCGPRLRCREQRRATAAAPSSPLLAAANSSKFTVTSQTSPASRWTPTASRLHVCRRN